MCVKFNVVKKRNNLQNLVFIILSFSNEQIRIFFEKTECPLHEEMIFFRL